LQFLSNKLKKSVTNYKERNGREGESP